MSQEAELGDVRGSVRPVLVHQDRSRAVQLGHAVNCSRVGLPHLWEGFRDSATVGGIEQEH